jgi:hypothetical protein
MTCWWRRGCRAYYHSSLVFTSELQEVTGVEVEQAEGGEAEVTSRAREDGSG